MPCKPYRLCADAYVGGLAPFFGPVAGIVQPLALYRIHGANYYNFRDLTPRAESERRMERLIAEFDHLGIALQERFGIDPCMSLEDNPRYHRFRRVLDKSYPLRKVLAATFRTPTLPAPMKSRELANLILGRR